MFLGSLPMREMLLRREGAVLNSINNAESYAVYCSGDESGFIDIFVLCCVMLKCLFTESQICYDLIGWGYFRNCAQKRHLNTSFMNFMTRSDRFLKVHFKGVFCFFVTVFSFSAECLVCNGMIIILPAESKMLSEM